MRVIIRYAALLSALLTTAVLMAADEAAPAPQAGFRVIVHPKNPIKDSARQFIADAFLKKVTLWPDDSAIRPVDLRPNSTTRIDFTRDVLRRSIQAVRAYWQQRIFSGRGCPPVELESEEAVVTYVLSHPGAIGYISETVDPRGAKALPLSD